MKLTLICGLLVLLSSNVFASGILQQCLEIQEFKKEINKLETKLKSCQITDEIIDELEDELSDVVGKFHKEIKTFIFRQAVSSPKLTQDLRIAEIDGFWSSLKSTVQKISQNYFNSEIKKCGDSPTGKYIHTTEYYDGEVYTNTFDNYLEAEKYQMMMEGEGLYSSSQTLFQISEELKYTCIPENYFHNIEILDVTMTDDKNLKIKYKISKIYKITSEFDSGINIEYTPMLDNSSKILEGTMVITTRDGKFFGSNQEIKQSVSMSCWQYSNDPNAREQALYEALGNSLPGCFTKRERADREAFNSKQNGSSTFQHSSPKASKY